MELLGEIASQTLTALVLVILYLIRRPITDPRQIGLLLNLNLIIIIALHFRHCLYPLILQEVFIIHLIILAI